MFVVLLLITVATTIGTVVAYLIVPMRSLGQDSWKIAAALMGRHIGGGNLWSHDMHTFTNIMCIIYICGTHLLFEFVFSSSLFGLMIFRSQLCSC